MKVWLVSFVLAWMNCYVEAQDIHYTQFFNSPLTLNPALTGFTRGGYRVGAAVRSQWFGGANNSSFNSVYVTPSVFFDAPIAINNDAIGLGALFISDQTVNRAISGFSGCVSFSFIKSLGKKNQHQLAFGAQLGYTNKTIKKAQLPFYSPFLGETFAAKNQNGGTFSTINSSLININAGALWFSRINQRVSIYAGGSVNNLWQPQTMDTLKVGSGWFLRWSAHSGVDITLGRLVHLLPCAMFVMHKNASEILPGLSIAYDITPVSTISLGSLFRANDFYTQKANAEAVAIYSSFDFKGFKLGVSYDFPLVSKLKAKSGVGALEVTAIYIGKRKNNKSIIFCPLF